MSALHLEPLSAATASAANRLTLKPGQEQYSFPVSHTEAAPTVSPAAAWPRVVLDGDEVVGFVQGHFDPGEPRAEFRCAVWQVNVKGSAQGRGVGRFALHALADEARHRGASRLTVIFEPGDHGPEAFFRGIGFVPVGETPFGEVLAALDL